MPLRHAVELEHDAARLDARHPEFGRALPEPMRTSAGFFVTGTSGKMRIQTRPARFMARVIARRAASIWRAVMRSGSTALRP